MQKFLPIAKSSLFEKTFITFSLLFAFLWNSNLLAQNVTSYTFSETNSAQTYTPITGGTVFATDATFGAAPYNVTPALPVGGFGFDFNFNGTLYDGTATAGKQCYISDNGFITFGATAPTAITYLPISGLGTYNGTVSGFTNGFGLAPAFRNSAYGANNGIPTSTTGSFVSTLFPSEIRYQTIGSAPNRVFVVQYYNMIRNLNGGGSLTGLLSFQIRLYETTNIIEVVYNSPFSGVLGTGTTNQQVGLRGLAAAIAPNLDFNNRKSAWLPNTTAGTAPTDSMFLTSAVNNFPTAITKFTWSPCYQVRSLSATAVPSSVVTWSAPWIPVTGNYSYEIRTSGAFGSGAAGLVASGTVASPATTFNTPTLTVGQTYTVYVQSPCGGTPTSTTVTPICGPSGIPYVQDFETSVVPALPLCNSINTVVGQPFVTKFNATVVLPAKTFTTKYITCAGGTNSWYFTQAINIATAGTYKLSYDYGNTREFAFNEQKMRVAFGLNNTITSGTMTGATILEDHLSIKDSPLSNVINFVVTTPGVYYVGFQCYGVNNSNNTLQLDNIVLDFANCSPPTAITASNITTSTALINWTNSVSGPDGYVYYYSTSSTPPVNSNITGNGITSANSAPIAGLLGATQYYVWVRSICDAGDQYGAWTPLTVPGAFFTTLTPPPAYCVSNAGATSLNYFTNVTTNNAAANINNTSTYSTNGYGDFTSQVVRQAIGGSVQILTSYNLINTTNDLGVAVFVDWNQDGDFVDAGETVYNSAAFLTSPPIINFTVPATALLGATRMRMVVDWNLTNPLACGTKTRGETEDYTFLVETAPPALSLNITTSIQCASSNSPLVTVNGPSYDVFSWSPSAGVTGNNVLGYTFNTNVSKTYTLTATQTLAPFRSNTVKFVYNAVKLPTPIIIAPTAPVACQSGPAVKLTASGGIVDGIPIFQENFEDTDNEFTYTGVPSSPINNNSTMGTGNPLLSNWVFAQSPYTTVGFTPVTVTSNDSSQFYIADSDAGGSGVTTDVTLLSNPINLATIGVNPITDASLTFFHYYRSWINGTANVEISINGGGSWIATPLASYSSVTQGAPTGFVKVEIPLAAYVGNNNVRIRFKYNTLFGWRWAIDNVEITASSNSNVLWNTLTSPVATGVAVPGLYTDAGAITAYNAGSAAASVYALPTVATTYSATVKSSAPNFCPTTANMTVTTQAIVAGTVSSAQTVCSGVANDLTISGQVGNIQWETANTLAFTIPSNIGTVNATTLTSAQIGAVVTTKYYRAKITNGVCTTYSNIVSIGTSAVTYSAGAWSNGSGPTISDGAIFQSNFTSTGNINACSVTILSGAVVTIASNHVLTVQNGLNTTAGSLFFNNGASLIQNNNLTNTTPINYRRNSTLMNLYDYTYWSSPVAGQTLFNFSPLTRPDKYYYWNTTPAVYNWTSNLNGTFTMNAGQGYLVRSPLVPGDAPAIYNGSFVGNPNNGTITRPIEVSGATNEKNLNLIGNPYPSALSANLFLTANSSVIDGTIFFWSHNTPISGVAYTTNDYASYNLTGGSGTKAANNVATGGIGNNTIPTGNIASGQGFFAIGKILGINNATFTNAMRISTVSSNNNFYRNSDNTSIVNDYEKHRIWLEVSNTQGAFSQLLYGNIEGATNAKDQLYDGGLFDYSPTVSIYSILDNHKLTIKGNGLPFNETDTNQIGYISKIAGDYQIKLAMFDGLFESQNIYLEDKYLNIIHDLKSSDYSFTTNIGTFDDRFVLRFNNTVLSSNNPISDSNKIIVYKDLKGIYIKSIVNEIKDIIIFDATGRKIISKINLNEKELIIKDLQVAQQVLLIQITTIDGKVSTRKIVF